MPVFNGETYLAEAVRSVLGQTLKELEVVAVDDGSRDGSRAILERFARADRRVRLVVNDQNLGVSESRNTGWRLARAPYIACLDADDIALPDRLFRQVEFLDAHPSVAAVGGGVFTIDANGRRLSMRRYPTKSRVIRSTLLRHNCLAHSSVTMRRAALEAVGGYRFNSSEDYDLWLRLSERFELANLSEPVSLYRQHLSQQSFLILEKDAKGARAVRAAAQVRRSTGVDPLAGVRDLTPEIIDGLNIDHGELSTAFQRELIARAAILADLGHHQEAEQLVEHASRALGRRAAKAFEATMELRQAEARLHARRPLAAVGHVFLAFVREPRHALSLLTAWLGPRIPGGSLLRWT
jgi:hypothetical protein